MGKVNQYQMNLLMQHAIHFMQYVDCIMHNVCTHMDAYTNKCTLCHVLCDFLWEMLTNCINEIYSTTIQLLGGPEVDSRCYEC